MFQWLVLSESGLYASPDLSKTDPEGNLRGTWVLPNGRVGFVSDVWNDLNSALTLMFADSAIVKRCKKLIDSEADFRCLMAVCGLGKLPFSVADKLNFGADAPVPSTAPPLPKGIDALMLVPRYKGLCFYGIEANGLPTMFGTTDNLRVCPDSQSSVSCSHQYGVHTVDRIS